MTDEKGKRSLMMPIGITIGVVGVAVFVFLHFFASDFFAAEAEQTPDTTESVRAVETPLPTPEPTPPPTPAPPNVSVYSMALPASGNISVQMDKSDINRGFLVLVNTENAYTIPDGFNAELVNIAANRLDVYRATSNSRLRRDIIEPFNEMLQAFTDETDKTYIYVLSGFRDYNAQRALLNQYIYTEGREAAMRRASQPGHSEHHTGLAVDFATMIDGVQYPFDNFDVAKNWFSRNSYRFGFALSYPAHKTRITGVISEPWHYRYVGLPHSYIMYNNDWVLAEYVEAIRDYTADEPMKVKYDGAEYEVFFTENLEITVPSNAKYQISGNNVDGFIVTIYDRYDRLTNVTNE